MQTPDMFNPKKIILNAITDKLEHTGVVRVIMIFSVDTDNYRIMVSGEDKENTAITITNEELNTVKKVFISKIIKAWKRQFDIEPKDVIIQIDIKEKTLELFIEDYKKNVLKFDY